MAIMGQRRAADELFLGDSVKQILLLIIILIGLLASTASAQLPGLRRYTPADNARRPGAPAAPLVGIDAMRADFAATSGGTTVYFAADSVILSP